MISIALLGAGRIGQIHGRTIAASKRAKLAGIADPMPDGANALSAATGAPVRTAEELIADRSIDAVLIATPTDTHADFIDKAAAAGKAVLCEKPVDMSSARIRETLARVEKAGVKLMIGFNRRFDPNFAALQRRLAEGVAGNVELVTILSRDPAPPPVSYIERSGGLYRDMMIHDFDMARFLLGEEPIEVYAVGSALVEPAIGKAGDVDTAAVLMKTASGKICHISNSRRATYGYDQRIEVHGSKGLLSAANVHETTVSFAGVQGFTADPVQNFFLERYAAAYRNEVEAFIDAVVDGKTIAPNGHDGLCAQMLADAATESRETGKPVKVS
ncbi:inositol 2-dehydrogenase [Mesorhizobium sp. BAC0120]|uniref:inositol 2-dehydrogenase n=1 Tax=Mesorhizobium sp. BAC0120 TaxID=3090670 RepID=UPI00298CA537|nr:inositol 2-dehydrogenase [Mesorhizobium sp. BAC0120]MDW6025571.1 inositol 2-dehydrogenase [Mesorhizobium sp. BAC0120]